MVGTLSGVVVKLCQIRSTCQCSVELLIYQVTDSAKLLTKALSGSILDSLPPPPPPPILLRLSLFPPLPLSLLILYSPFLTVQTLYRFPTLSLHLCGDLLPHHACVLILCADCSLLTSEGIEVAAVKFKLLESLLTTYNISAIISDDSKVIIIVLFDSKKNDVL